MVFNQYIDDKTPYDGWYYKIFFETYDEALERALEYVTSYFQLNPQDNL